MIELFKDGNRMGMRTDCSNALATVRPSAINGR
jgi:hypothetical protein